MQIVVLDDSHIQRRIIIKLIREVGYNDEIIEGDNGREGLDNIAKEGRDIRLVLCDWNMPQLNGLQFLYELNKIPKYRGMPAIMITTEGTTRAYNEAKSQYPYLAGYVVKPFTHEHLKAVISPYLHLQDIKPGH